MHVAPPPSSRRHAPRSVRAMRAIADAPVRVFDGPEHALHAELNAWNRTRLTPGVPSANWERELERRIAMTRIERAFLESEQRKVAARAALAPTDAAGFVAWFEELRQSGPGQWDPLFDFLATQASFEQVRWFVKQEVAGEAGFEDLVALTQIKAPERPKLEMARNYWDEMGRGKPAGMHGPLLTNLARALCLEDTPDRELVWEALAMGNMMVGLAAERQYAYHSMGALGVIELTAPTRARKVADALERIGLSGKATHYFRLHATVDIGHSRDWNAEILGPIIESQPAVAVHVAEGALMRLNAGARTFDRYRAVLGVEAPRAQID
jgi:hypothetical protein